MIQSITLDCKCKTVIEKEHVITVITYLQLVAVSHGVSGLSAVCHSEVNPVLPPE